MLPDDHFRDLFATFGAVTVRRMFGGQGIFFDGMMIALVADGVLYLKSDDVTRSRFEAAGGVPFAYDGKGRRVTTSYYTLPDAAADEPDTLKPWAEAALEAARRSQAGKSAKPRRKR